ncbi:MAG: PAS domain S-box protein [Erysipelotrichales bacterium]|nr:MAG: PAS domain S-box protein [Erysipelotrichales bacterium]
MISHETTGSNRLDMRSVMKTEVFKVLVIEDDNERFSGMLSLFAECFPNATMLDVQFDLDLLKYIESENPDILLIDSSVTKVNGFDICRKLKDVQDLPSFPVIYIFDKMNRKDERVLALECGADAYINKPIDKSEFSVTIRSMLKIRAFNQLKYAEKNASEESKTDFSQRIQLLPNGIVIFKVINGGMHKRDFICQNSNAQAEHIFGKEKHQIIGKSLFELKSDFFPPSMVKTFKAVLRTGTSKSISTDINESTNSKNAYEIQVVRISHSEIFIMYLDISEKRELQTKLEECEIRFKYVFDYSAIGKSITKLTGEILVNYKMCEFLGYSMQEMTGRRWQEISHPDDEALTDRMITSLMNGEKDSIEFEKRYIRKDGTIFWGEIHSSMRRDRQGRPLYLITSIIDITDRKRDRENLLQQNNLFTSLLKLLPVGVFMVDSNSGKPLVANDAAMQFLGRGILQDADMHNLSEVYKAHKVGSTDPYPPQEMPIILGMQGKSSHIDDLVVERPDGSERLLEIFGTPVTDSQGKTWASLVTFFDITEHKKAEEKLIYLSYHDFLTGLYNRRFFEEEVLRLNTERNLPITIVMGDLNGLKLINDSFGHAVGDEYLKKAAKIIKETFRTDDIISRIGGDEFAILLIRTDANEAKQILARLKAKASFESTETIDLSIAFGYQTKTEKDEDISKTMEGAENNMYRQKLFDRESVRSKTIDIIMNTLFEKSIREMQHSKRVSEICEIFATALEYEKNNVDKIKLAGLVHDIGKIGISETILNKPSKLLENEREEIQKHSESGWRILTSAAEFPEIAGFILSHHERWDGSGYPKGLKGKEISQESRIIALADAYDAMTNDQPYRKKLDRSQAVREIQNHAGQQFDPELVKFFIEKVVPHIK